MKIHLKSRVEKVLTETPQGGREDTGVLWGKNYRNFMTELL